MNKQKLQKLVDDAVSLHREVATKTELLKALKAELVQEAKLHPEAQMTTTNGGKRWAADGSDGCTARVNFPAAALVSEMDSQSELAEQCKRIAGERFRRLFTPVKICQLVEDFRAQTVALLPASAAEELVKLCETEASPRVSFETAKQKSAALAEV